MRPVRTFFNIQLSNSRAAQGETNASSEGTKGTDGIFTYAIGGDTGNTLNPLTADDRFGLMTCHLLYSHL